METALFSGIIDVSRCRYHFFFVLRNVWAPWFFFPVAFSDWPCLVSIRLHVFYEHLSFSILPMVNSMMDKITLAPDKLTFVCCKKMSKISGKFRHHVSSTLFLFGLSCISLPISIQFLFFFLFFFTRHQSDSLLSGTSLDDVGYPTRDVFTLVRSAGQNRWILTSDVVFDTNYAMHLH